MHMLTSRRRKLSVHCFSICGEISTWDTPSRCDQYRRTCSKSLSPHWGSPSQCVPPIQNSCQSVAPVVSFVVTVNNPKISYELKKAPHCSCSRCPHPGCSSAQCAQCLQMNVTTLLISAFSSYQTIIP